MSKSFFLSSGLVTQGSRLLRLHSFYSLFLALMLLMVTVFDRNHVIVGSVNPDLMLSSSALYVILAALFAVVANRFPDPQVTTDRKSTRLNSSHVRISYAVFCLKKKSRR